MKTDARDIIVGLGLGAIMLLCYLWYIEIYSSSGLLAGFEHMAIHVKYGFGALVVIALTNMLASVATPAHRPERADYVELQQERNRLAEENARLTERLMEELAKNK